MVSEIKSLVPVARFTPVGASRAHHSRLWLTSDNTLPAFRRLGHEVWEGAYTGDIFVESEAVATATPMERLELCGWGDGELLVNIPVVMMEISCGEKMGRSPHDI
ncbi:hypothetical protein RRG08_052451 [Elysia crispata]|uniref:Uncharacterized protein n=1 Tax=Elysia crispata TaxID=231223 RepID=A0AAE1E8G7_9GAST|nr:hypothetical protein RRG08_052451 [Elysia crispata]